MTQGPGPFPVPAPPATVDIGVALRYLGLDRKDPGTVAMVAVCERYGLDPLLGHIIVLPNRRIYITRDGYLDVAHRSGQFDGMRTDTERRNTTDDGWTCYVKVWRKDMAHPFRVGAQCKDSERQAKQGFGPEQALARAERRTLKRAFPVQVDLRFAAGEHDEPPEGDAAYATAEVDPEPYEPRMVVGGRTYDDPPGGGGEREGGSPPTPGPADQGVTAKLFGTVGRVFPASRYSDNDRDNIAAALCAVVTDRNRGGHPVASPTGFDNAERLHLSALLVGLERGGVSATVHYDTTGERVHIQNGRTHHVVNFRPDLFVETAELADEDPF